MTSLTSRKYFQQTPKLPLRKKRYRKYYDVCRFYAVHLCISMDVLLECWKTQPHGSSLLRIHECNLAPMKSTQMGNLQFEHVQDSTAFAICKKKVHYFHEDTNKTKTYINKVSQKLRNFKSNDLELKLLSLSK